MGDETQTPYYEINSTLMEVTFLVYGPSTKEDGKTSFGTAFLMGKPRADGTGAYYVLVSATHVFDDIKGAVATLNVRKPLPDGRYNVEPFAFKLRNEKNENLYVKHKDVDVAAIYISMPNEFKSEMLSIDLLATDEWLKRFEIHPGDELNCLGYPLVASTEFGFPILRSGKIASYPIVPTSVHKNILFDFQVFEGNSGGPVYFVDRSRYYGGQTHLGEIIQFVVGLVTSQLSSKIHNQLLQLAAVVPAPYVREVIAQLPAKSPY